MPKLKIEVARRSDHGRQGRRQPSRSSAKTGQIGDGKIFVFDHRSRGAHPHRREPTTTRCLKRAKTTQGGKPRRQRSRQPASKNICTKFKQPAANVTYLTKFVRKFSTHGRRLNAVSICDNAGNMALVYNNLLTPFRLSGTGFGSLRQRHAQRRRSRDTLVSNRQPGQLRPGPKRGSKPDENRHGHHQAIQARRGPRRSDCDRRARA
mgnify:CR=1 FL=1